MIPKLLCHYTKKDVALEKILFERKIKIGQMGLTNDPRESKWRSVPFGLTNHKVEDLLDKIPTIQNEIQRISKEEWKVLCMTTHFPADREPNFQEGYYRPAMWAHYAENHAGVCMIFDGEKLHENIGLTLKEGYRIFHGPVIYKNYQGTVKCLECSNIIDHGPTEAIREYFLENYDQWFLTKDPDWEKETEYRWLIHNINSSPVYASIEGAIKAVVVGTDFPKAYEPAITELCKELNIPVGRVNWGNGIPCTLFTEIFAPKEWSF